MNKHFTFIKPAMINNTLPSAINLSKYIKNPLTPIDDTLPYIYQGGAVSFSRSVEIQVNTGDFYICAYVSKGKISLISDDKSVDDGLGLAIFACKSTTYTLKTLSRDATIHLYFVNGAVLDSYLKMLSSCYGHQSIYCKHFDLDDFILAGLNKLDSFISSEDENSLYMESLIFQYIFVRLLNNENSNNLTDNSIPLYLSNLKKILDTRYDEAHTLESLSMELEINKYRLCREFSATFDISPLKYLNQVRIEKAKELLVETNDTIVSIGESVGIENTTHFINLFKKQTGDTPLKYRQSHLSNKADNITLFSTPYELF